MTRLTMNAKIRSALGIYLAGTVLLHAVLFWNSWDSVKQGYADFTAFYAAGTAVRMGAGARLYDLESQRELQSQFVTGARTSTVPLPFLRPAFEALPFALLSFLPHAQAHIAWDVLSVFLLCALAFLLRPHLSQLSRISWWIWMLILLGFFPIFETLLQGQDTVLLLFLFALVYLAIKRNADFAAGCWLGLATFKPQMALPFLVVMLFRPGRGKFLSGFLLTAGALVFISAGVTGWGPTLRYPQYLLEMNRRLGNGSIIPSGMPNLRGLSQYWHGDAMPSWLVQGLLGLLSVLLLWIAARFWTRVREGERYAQDTAFSVTMLVTLLISYHTNLHDLCLLILPILLQLNLILSREGENSSADFWTLGIIAVLFFTPLYVLLLDYGRSSLLASLVLLLTVIVAVGTSAEKKDRASTSPSIGR